jgi:trehalose 6-phosphate phosphatase
MPAKLPTPLPRGLLRALAQGPGLMLCLDYDGTLAEITTDPASAWPYPGVREQLQRLNSLRNKVSVAIITGRALSDVKRLLGIESGLFFSGVHGLELDEPGAQQPSFSADALKCTSELAMVRQWLSDNVPGGRGFVTEDKRVALGLHYRLAQATEAAALCDRFARFVARETPDLKLVRLKMLAEAMPRAASKARALISLKTRIPASYVTAYFGDDTTDEDALSALEGKDVGILVGAERPSHAAYRVDGPAAVLDQLYSLTRMEM